MEEMRAQCFAAAWQAECDFDLRRGVPLGAFVYQRVMASALKRYREEWRYAVHCNSRNGEDEHKSAIRNGLSSGGIYEPLYCVLMLLAEPDRRLIEQLFWEECTETEIAQLLGVSHQAVSKRKRAILRKLGACLGYVKKT